MGRQGLDRTGEEGPPRTGETGTGVDGSACCGLGWRGWGRKGTAAMDRSGSEWSAKVEDRIGQDRRGKTVLDWRGGECNGSDWLLRNGTG